MAEPTTPRHDPAARWRFAGRALGSPLRLTIRGADREAAERAWRAVVAELAATDIALSRFRDDSELTRLNRWAGTGRRVVAGRRLRVALAAMDRARRMTEGRFDARVLRDLERLGEHGAVLSRPHDRGVSDPRCRGTVATPPWPLDTGGIGKGLALRWARDEALRRLPDTAGLLLEAGGDLAAGGTPPDGGWLVAIEDPVAIDVDAADPVVVVALTGDAVATSSIRRRRWIAPDGTAVHHLIDPRTRAPARTGLIAVSVAGPDPAWAEVWSKALFLAGHREIADEARARGLAAWWIDADGGLGLSPGGRIQTAWAAEWRLGQGAAAAAGRQDDSASSSLRDG